MNDYSATTRDAPISSSHICVARTLIGGMRLGKDNG